VEVAPAVTILNGLVSFVKKLRIVGFVQPLSSRASAGMASLLAQEQVHDPAATNVRSRTPEMVDNVLVRTTCLLQGIRKDREAGIVRTAGAMATGRKRLPMRSRTITAARDFRREGELLNVKFTASSGVQSVAPAASSARWAAVFRFVRAARLASLPAASNAWSVSSPSAYRSAVSMA
jgi:hypothetical protein